MSRGDLTEVGWRILKVLLPVERESGKRGRGRPPQDNRNVVNSILWRLRTGAPWRDVPEKYENWNTIYRRFLRWSKSGVWESVATALVETMAESGHYSIDSTTVRAHVSAAGGKGGFINELLAARGASSPVRFTVSVMQRDAPSPSSLRQERPDCKKYETLIELAEQAPNALIADKAYDTDPIRDDLRRRRIKPVKVEPQRAVPLR